MNDYDKLTKKIAKLDLQRTRLIIERQAVCQHNHIEEGGGGMWHEWPSYGAYPKWARCNDCGLQADANKDWQTYKLLKDSKSRGDQT